MKRLFLAAIVLSVSLLAAVLMAYAWGITGHILINRVAAQHLPAGMSAFKADSLFFASHSFDADVRIDVNDTSFFAEWPRHYFNIDDYPSFRTLTHNLDSLVMQFGWEYVKEDGVNPWATQWTLDSLTAQLARGDTTAKYTASDLGHYVAEGHQPMRCTVNSDGQFTGNYGIKARYETYMLNIYHASIFLHADSVQYISSPVDFAFSYILHAHSRVDSVLNADTYAKAVSGWDGIGTAPSSYYTALWEKCQSFTQDQIQRATVDIASLWYTAWINAGLSTSVREFAASFPHKFELSQNYPNPFNPLTRISYTLTERAIVRLTIVSLDGRTIALLANEKQEPGVYSLNFDGSSLASGVYFYSLMADGVSSVRKMLLIR